jgi:hypothetical protein
MSQFVLQFEDFSRSQCVKSLMKRKCLELVPLCNLGYEISVDSYLGTLLKGHKNGHGHGHGH